MRCRPERNRSRLHPLATETSEVWETSEVLGQCQIDQLAYELYALTEWKTAIPKIIMPETGGNNHAVRE